MTRPNRPRYAARLNAFKAGLSRPTTADLISRAAEVEGMDAADLNFPDHFEGTTPAALTRALSDNGMALNGLAMRYYADPGFRLGAFTHPEARVRRAAIDLTKRGLDAAMEMGASVMTLWLGQDGVDYSFQGDFARMWDDTVSDGLVLHDGATTHLPAHKITPISSHGAGDAFIGALAARLATGAPLAEAARFAAAAAALHVATAPADRAAIAPENVVGLLTA